MAQKKTLSTRIPEAWFDEIDSLIARKFPHRNRSEWLHDLVERELLHQRDGLTKDTLIDETLALVREIHAATVQKERTHANN